jgi:hypothetical protein
MRCMGRLLVCVQTAMASWLWIVRVVWNICMCICVDLVFIPRVLETEGTFPFLE